jgi:hypothetical protein
MEPLLLMVTLIMMVLPILMVLRLVMVLLTYPTGGTVTELDPDAPSRQGKTLQADNVRAEERLLARCWQLVRAGECWTGPATGWIWDSQEIKAGHKDTLSGWRWQRGIRFHLSPDTRETFNLLSQQHADRQHGTCTQHPGSAASQSEP